MNHRNMEQENIFKRFIKNIGDTIFGSGKSSKDEKQQVINKEKLEIPEIIEKNVIYCPLKGEGIELEKVNDPTFAQGLLGQGFAVNPKEGKVLAPFDGKIVTLFPTKHAVGIVSNDGLEVLIHIGLNTVELDGKYYETHVKEGDVVSIGQTLVTFNIDKINKAGYETTTPVLVTNSDDYEKVSVIKTGDVDFMDKVIKAE